MNFTNLIFWSVTIISGMAGTYHIDVVQKAIWSAQAKLIYQSRTETWGIPKVLVPSADSRNSKIKKSNKVAGEIQKTRI